jgi:hypothetical protein
MKKTVLKWGLLSGAVSGGMMLATIPFARDLDFDRGEVLGYTTIVLASLLIFFGVRSYRETVGAGRLSFGRGLAVGLLITAVSALCYVAVWEVIYFGLMPDFAEKYGAYMVDKAKAGGASAEKVADVTRRAADLKRLLDNPLTNAAIAFLEPLPIGALAALISAAVLRRREAPATPRA